MKLLSFILVLTLSTTLYAQDTSDNNKGGAPSNVEAVDLGLPSGIKWASMNIGANAPEEYGDYFAWGEIYPHYEKGHWIRIIPFFGKKVKKVINGIPITGAMVQKPL